MTAVAFFALYAAAAATLAPAALHGGWVTRSPRLAISLWLVLAVSWVIAVVMAVLAVAVPFLLVWAGPQPGSGGLLGGPQLPGGGVVAAAGLALAVALVLWAGWCLAAELRSGWRDRREFAALVAATGRPGPERDVVILDHDAPVIYCTASGRNRIVVSAGALTALTPAQIRTVIAHERAHLRCRHHTMLAFARALARAFPRVPLLAQAEGQLRVLAEMAADDSAARGHRRDDLAAALVILARGAPHPAALAAGGPAALARLERMLAPQQRTGLDGLVAAAGLVPPAAIACVPLIIAVCDLVTHAV
jgi:bla regulator protein blaR1